MRRRARILAVLGACALAGACGDSQAPAQPGSDGPVPRWFGAEHAAYGEPLFQRHCARCHGARAEGAENWREPGPDGRYPAPPLDGSGHGWHHPLPVLYRVIMEGSPGGQGNMPAWGGVLERDQALAIIAWFQSLWPDPIYAAWARRDAAARAGGG